jgi:hypothetical protein
MKALLTELGGGAPLQEGAQAPLQTILAGGRGGLLLILQNLSAGASDYHNPSPTPPPQNDENKTAGVRGGGLEGTALRMWSSSLLWDCSWPGGRQAS